MQTIAASSALGIAQKHQPPSRHDERMAAVQARRFT
jgi:hypothetical protein